MSQAKQLIDIFLDKDAYEEERQDAIMDISLFNDPIIVDALLLIIQDEEETYDMRCDACESLAEYWERNAPYNKKVFLKVPKQYRHFIYDCYLDFNPIWYEELKKLDDENS